MRTRVITLAEPYSYKAAQGLFDHPPALGDCRGDHAMSVMLPIVDGAPVPTLLRRYLFTGAEHVGGRVRLVGAPHQQSDDDLDFFFSPERLADNPIEERVHFWTWFAEVGTGSANPTWFVECWSAQPPTADVLTGGPQWSVVAEGSLETAELKLDVATGEEMGSSDRTVGVLSIRSGVRVHLVDAAQARRLEAEWFDRQCLLAGDAWEYPPENPAYEINPVVVQVWPL